MNTVSVELTLAEVAGQVGVDASVSDEYQESGTFFVAGADLMDRAVGDILSELHGADPEAADILDAALQNDTPIYVDDCVVASVDRARLASNLRVLETSLPTR